MILKIKYQIFDKTYIEAKNIIIAGRKRNLYTGLFFVIIFS